MFQDVDVTESAFRVFKVIKEVQTIDDRITVIQLIGYLKGKGLNQRPSDFQEVFSKVSDHMKQFTDNELKRIILKLF